MLIFTNVQTNWCFVLFADDTNFHYEKKTPLIIKVQKLYNWFTSKKLSFNTVKKSNFAVFHPQLKQRSYQTKRYIFDNKYVNLVSKAYIIYHGVLIAYRAGFCFTKACLNFDSFRPPFGSKETSQQPSVSFIIQEDDRATRLFKYVCSSIQASVFIPLTKLPVCWKWIGIRFSFLNWQNVK